MRASSGSAAAVASTAAVPAESTPALSESRGDPVSHEGRAYLDQDFRGKWFLSDSLTNESVAMKCDDLQLAVHPYREDK